MNYKREQLNLKAPTEVIDFVNALNEGAGEDEYCLEDLTGTRRADARTLLGATYASIAFNGQIFLVNETQDGVFPHSVDQFKK